MARGSVKLQPSKCANKFFQITSNPREDGQEEQNTMFVDQRPGERKTGINCNANCPRAQEMASLCIPSMPADVQFKACKSGRV
jgi:hypothetical protein